MRNSISMLIDFYWILTKVSAKFSCVHFLNRFYLLVKQCLDGNQFPRERENRSIKHYYCTVRTKKKGEKSNKSFFTWVFENNSHGRIRKKTVQLSNRASFIENRQQICVDCKSLCNKNGIMNHIKKRSSKLVVLEWQNEGFEEGQEYERVKRGRRPHLK